jgi:3-methyladenine DNA glycosylase/8-oxoguanine DNA glycosylase
VGQQVSLHAAQKILARLVEQTGRVLAGRIDRLTHLFPTPEALTGANLNRIGLTKSRVTTLKKLSEAVVEKKLDFSKPVEDVIRALAAIPGIGTWSAQYIVLRALGDPDAFPSGDLLLRRLASNCNGLMAESDLEQQSEAWRPWRAYAAVHLWCTNHSGLKWRAA